MKAESVQSPGAIVLPGGLLLSPPHVLTEVVAPFPEAARQNRRTGHVVMKVEVKETGDVGRVEVVESAGADFDAAAADAMRRFAFKPACSPEGTPVAAYIHYKYLFGSP